MTLKKINQHDLPIILSDLPLQEDILIIFEYGRQFKSKFVGFLHDSICLSPVTEIINHSLIKLAPGD